MAKQMLLNVIDKYAPKVKICLKSKRNLWLDAETFKLKYYFDKLYHKAIALKLEEDLSKHKTAGNDYSRLIRTKMDLFL
jgi:hypothetical protein